MSSPALASPAVAAPSLAAPATAAPAAAARPHRHGWWWKTLAVGVPLWIATVLVTIVTSNAVLVPTVILLGSFLIPFAVVMFAAERIRGVTAGHLVVAFAVGGIAGVLGASLLEANLSAEPWAYVLVGLIEEAVKLAVVLVVGWRVLPKTAGQGALLGATIGAGFAAFESAGYAFTSALTQSGISVVSLVQTEVLRAVLSPVGHILWSAAIAAVVFGVAGAARSERFRFSWAIPIALAGVALLHALWDSLSGIATYLALVGTGQVATYLRYGGLPPQLASQVQVLAIGYYVAGIVITALLGLGAAAYVLLHYRRLEREAATAPAAPVTA